MSYNGHQDHRRDNRRSQPYQAPYENPHYGQEQHQGYQGRHEGRGQFENRGGYSGYNRQSYHQQDQGYSGGYQPHYGSSSSIPSFSHSSNFNDRNYHDRRSDSYDRRSDSFDRRNDNNGQRNDQSNYNRGNEYRRSMPELRQDLQPTELPSNFSRQSDERSNTQLGNGFQSNNSYSGPPMDLQMRTLRVTAGNGYEFDKRLNKDVLQELFIQVGPVRNIVLKNSFAFVEFQDTDSVAYALAAMDGVQLFGKTLNLEPKIKSDEAFKYSKNLRLFEERPELFGQPRE